jgi:uncharacterized membrane protein YfcA
MGVGVGSKAIASHISERTITIICGLLFILLAIVTIFIYWQVVRALISHRTSCIAADILLPAQNENRRHSLD